MAKSLKSKKGVMFLKPKIRDEILYMCREFYDVAEAFKVFGKLYGMVMPDMKESECYGYEHWKKTEVSSLMQEFHKGLFSISGPLGSGKTTLLKSIALDVMDGKYKNLQDVEIVHYIDWQQVTNRDLQTPAQLLFGNVFPRLMEHEKYELIEFTRANPDKVLFLIDSLDSGSLRPSSPFLMSHPPLLVDVHYETDPVKILHHLLCNRLFPNCRIITASRSPLDLLLLPESHSRSIALTKSHDSIKKIKSGYLSSDHCDKIILQSNPPLYSGTISLNLTISV